MWDFLTALHDLDAKDLVAIGGGAGMALAAALSGYSGRRNGHPEKRAEPRAPPCRIHDVKGQMAELHGRLESLEEITATTHSAIGRVETMIARIDGRTGG